MTTENNDLNSSDLIALGLGALFVGSAVALIVKNPEPSKDIGRAWLSVHNARVERSDRYKREARISSARADEAVRTAGRAMQDAVDAKRRADLFAW